MLRLLFVIFILSSTSVVYTQGVQAYMNYCVFNSPTDGPYVETYMSVIGKTVSYQKNENGLYQGKIAVEITFEQKEEEVFKNRYNLFSPEVSDTTAALGNFLDQQRIPLEAGNYKMSISIKDANSEADAYESSTNIVVGFPTDDISFSSIQLIESYNKSETPSIITKSGYDLIPYPTNFFPSNMEKIVFYGELYNSNKKFEADGRFLFNYFIESYETGVKLTDYNAFSRQTANDVNVVLSKFSIVDLPSGNYNLVIEVRDTKNELVGAKRCFFQRSNPKANLKIDDVSSLPIEGTFVDQIKSIDTLQDLIASTRPISTNLEILFSDNQLDNAERLLMQQYLLNFWKSRDQMNPEGAFLAYKERVESVNKKYGTRHMKGYQTDRGRVMLRYGPPNSATLYDNMRSNPYEIWHYYKLGAQSNIKFIFVNENQSTNFYRLVHSDAVGEISDPTWRMKTDVIELDNVNQNHDGFQGTQNRLGGE